MPASTPLAATTTTKADTPTDIDKAIVSQVLGQLEAEYLAERSFNELRDGERQKTMIARALAQQPQVMILDEPTAFLDWSNRLNVLVKLKEPAQSTGKSFLLSSHDLNWSARSPMNCGSWKIQATSPAERRANWLHMDCCHRYFPRRMER